jgi:hypothetical protein
MKCAIHTKYEGNMQNNTASLCKMYILHILHILQFTTMQYYAEEAEDAEYAPCKIALLLFCTMLMGPALCIEYGAQGGGYADERRHRHVEAGVLSGAGVQAGRGAIRVRASHALEPPRARHAAERRPRV